ncbi:MAG: diguanylate cyclase [Motiliproteus sp.]
MMLKFIHREPGPNDWKTASRIVLPLILLIVSVVLSFLVVVLYSAEKADQNAKAASETHLQAILKDKRSQLATLTKDYSYWDDTISNAFYKQDLEWIDSNLGSYLTDTFGISELFILDGKNHSILSLQAGLPVSWMAKKKIEGGLEELINSARKSGPIPIPTSGILLIDGHPALVGASVLTPEEKDSMLVPIPRPILILAKRLDDTRLSEISANFGLAGLQFQQNHLPQTQPDSASLAIHTLNHRALGSLVWMPEKPGTSVLNYITMPLTIALSLIAILGGVIIRASLLAARRLATANRLTSRLSCAIDHTNNAVLIVHRSGAIEYENSEFISLFQDNPTEEHALTLSELFPVKKYPQVYHAFMSAFNEQANWAGEFGHQAANGSKLWIHATITPVENHGSFSDAVCVISDITNIKQEFDDMSYIATHDALTGLVNRRLFNELLEQTVLLAKREARHSALLYLDLDGFKEINDTLGHTAGDQLLINVSERLKERVRESDIVARVGGDEFIVLLQSTEHRSDVEHAAINILTHLIKPMKISGCPIRISASIGIALIPENGITPEELTGKADLALYQSKEHGGNMYSFFNSTVE